MDKKEELQRRITTGQRNIDHLSSVASKLPPGAKRDDLADKSIRMLRSIGDLEDSFIHFYPGICLFMDRSCNSKNKGTFHCRECPDYYNAIYDNPGQQQLKM